MIKTLKGGLYMEKVTYDEYDKKLKKMRKMTLEPYYPTLEEIDIFYRDPKRFLWFAVFLYENNPKPRTNLEHYSKKNLGFFINDNLELIEEEHLA